MIVHLGDGEWLTLWCTHNFMRLHSKWMLCFIYIQMTSCIKVFMCKFRGEKKIHWNALISTSHTLFGYSCNWLKLKWFHLTLWIWAFNIPACFHFHSSHFPTNDFTYFIVPLPLLIQFFALFFVEKKRKTVCNLHNTLHIYTRGA